MMTRVVRDELQSPDVNIRLAGARKLNQLVGAADNEIAGLATAAVTDGDWLVRSEAVQALSDVATPAILDLLLRQLEIETNPVVLADLAEAAGEHRVVAAEPRLIELLTHNDFSVRGYAAWSLGLVGDETVAAHVKARLTRERSDRVIPCLEAALSRLGDRRAYASLTTISSNWTEWRATIALQSLKYLIREGRRGIINDGDLLRVADAILIRFPALEGDVLELRRLVESSGPEDPERS